jgi:Zn-dependent protease
MFGKSFTLFRILGFEIHVDVSWLILALLITWSLAAGLFPHSYQGLDRLVYWGMGLGGAVGLFASILFHEFSHSLVARRFGLPIKRITLFIFGGVAEMDDEPPSPRAEALMAVAGPVSSILLGIVFYIIGFAVNLAPGAIAVSGVLGYLALINWALAAFNLIPAFPLDGGRLLRAALWHYKQDLRRATRLSSRIGSGFGLVVIFLGVFNVLIGNVIGGIWQFMIGMFLRSAAQMSYHQVLLRKSLEGATVAKFMNKLPVTAPSSISIRRLVEEYIYRYHYKMFPVRDNEELLGCISTRKVQEIPETEWDSKTVADALDQCSPDNAVAPDMGAMQAFALMGRSGKSRLMVIEDGRLVGILSLKDMIGYLSARLEMEKNLEKTEK